MHSYPTSSLWLAFARFCVFVWTCLDSSKGALACSASLFNLLRLLAKDDGHAHFRPMPAPFKILLTGTGASHGDDWNRTDISDEGKLKLALNADDNPAWTCVKALDGMTLEIGTRSIIFKAKHLALSDTYDDSIVAMEKLHEEGGFDVMISVGTNFNFDFASTEQVAPRYGYDKVDIRGHYASKSEAGKQGFLGERYDVGTEVHTDGREVLRSLVDCSKLAEKVNEAGYEETKLLNGECASSPSCAGFSAQCLA